MIHRYIHDILTNGIATIKANPTILDDLFQENYELVAEEAEAIKTHFTVKGCNVRNGYPRSDTPYPAVCIVLGEEGEDEHVLGDSGGLVTDETDPNYRAEILTSFWQHAYRLLVITDHPDVTAYYYEIMKFIMLEGFGILSDDGCYDFHLSGNELAPDPRFIPEELFARQLVFKCNREFQRFDTAQKLFRAKYVSGIAVDSDGSPRDVGDVKTNVTTYIVGDEEDTE